MEYRIGNSYKIKSIGETEELTCPKCNEKVNLSVFSNFSTKLKADFPLIDAKNIYFLVCPKCSALFGVDTEKGNVFKKGSKLAIGNFDLKELEKFDV